MKKKPVPQKKIRTRAPKSIAKTGNSNLQFWSGGGGGAWQSSLFGSLGGGGGLHEPWTGSWQGSPAPEGANIPTFTSPLAFSAVYSCVTGIASDVGKLPIDLMREGDSGVWEKIDNSPFLPVLRRPNHYQTRIQFLEQWILSKLLFGNAYIGLERDNRGIVNQMYVLDPCRVVPLVASNGEVYYQLNLDILNTIMESIIVTASEIIHDRMECLWNPLVGVPPIYACAATVGLGNSIQLNSQLFFANASQPGGMLSAPGRISNETADRMKETFESRFRGVNIGRLFVAGDGLEFKPFAMTADQSQLVEQLGWAVEDVARAFHYPIYKLDSSKLPPYSGNNIQTLQMQYLSDCLQKHVESIELLIEDAFNLPSGMHVVLDTDVLLRMDTQTLYRAIGEGIRGQWLSPNEGRLKANLKPVKGGEYPFAQMQYIPLPNLTKQQAAVAAASTTTPATVPSKQESAVPREYVTDLISAAIRKELETSGA